MIKKIIIASLFIFGNLAAQNGKKELFRQGTFGYLGLGVDYHDASVGLVKAFKEYNYNTEFSDRPKFPMIKPFLQAGYGEELKYNLRYDVGLYLKYFSTDLPTTITSNLIQDESTLHYFNRGIQLNIVRDIDETEELKIGVGIDYSYVSISTLYSDYIGYFNADYFNDSRLILCPQIQWEPNFADKWLTFFVMGCLPLKQSNLEKFNNNLELEYSPKHFYDWSITAGIKITKFEASQE